MFAKFILVLPADMVIKYLKQKKNIECIKYFPWENTIPGTIMKHHIIWNTLFQKQEEDALVNYWRNLTDLS